MTAQTVAPATFPQMGEVVTLSSRRGEITFKVAISGEVAYAALENVRGEFAYSLRANWARLTVKQAAWAAYLAQQEIAPADSEAPDFSGLVSMIETAQRSGLKRIKVRLGDVILKPARIEGRVYVLSATEQQPGPYGMAPKYLGWFESNRTNLPSGDITAFLEDAAQDPTRAAKLHGQLTGSCSCCGRELTDPASISLGIGPVCARKYGLIG